MENDELEKKIRSLPKSLRREALQYINYLIARKEAGIDSKKGFSFNWEGGLSELKDRFTSVELQHQVNKWR